MVKYIDYEVWVKTGNIHDSLATGFSKKVVIKCHTMDMGADVINYNNKSL